MSDTPRSITSNPDRRSRFVPSIATLFRIGFAATVLLTLWTVHQCLVWRTDGLPFGTNYDPSTGKLYIQDFASIFELSRATVSGNVSAPYSAAGQLEFMKQWVGQPISVALGYGYSPTVWLIVSPLFAFSTLHAYVLWALVPALTVVWIAWGLVAMGWSERDPFALALIALAFSSGSYQGVVLLGQTSLVLGLIVVCLIYAARVPGRSGRTGFLLFLSTAKPPLALAMGVGLLWSRRWKPVVIAVGLVIVEVACVTAWLGRGWISDYWELLTHYTSDTAPPALQPFLGPTGMSNLRHFLFAGAGWSDRASTTTSVAVWGAAITAGTWFAFRARPSGSPLPLAFSLLLYSILCPHLTFTNDLMVVVVVWFLNAEKKLDGAVRAFALAALIVVLNFGPLKTFVTSDVGAHGAFAAKLGLLILVLMAPRGAAASPRAIPTRQ